MLSYKKFRTLHISTEIFTIVWNSVLEKANKNKCSTCRVEIFFGEVALSTLQPLSPPPVEIYNCQKCAQCRGMYVHSPAHSGKLVRWKSWNSLDNRGGGIWGLANTFFSKEVEREKHNLKCIFLFMNFILKLYQTFFVPTFCKNNFTTSKRSGEWKTQCWI